MHATADAGTVRPARSDRLVRAAAFGGVVGPIVFAAVVVAAGFVYDGYSHVHQKISELGGVGAEYAIVQNANFVVFGFLIVGFAWALGRVLGPPLIGPALVAYFGLSSCIAQAVFPCDVGCEGETATGLLHIITGLAGFVAAIAAMFVLARRFEGEPGLSSHARPTRIYATLALVGLVVFVVAEAVDAPSYTGLVQRAFVVFLLAWITSTAARLVRTIDAT